MQVREETHDWVGRELTERLRERPTRDAVQNAAAAAAEAALRAALSGDEGWLATQQQQLAIQGKQLHAQQQVLAQTSHQVQQSASDLNATVVRTASQAAQSGTQLALGGGGLGGGLGGGGLNVMLQQVRELLMMTSDDL